MTFPGYWNDLPRHQARCQGSLTAKRRAERGLDSVPASAILCYPGNVRRFLTGPPRRGASRALRGVLAPGLALSSGPDRRVPQCAPLPFQMLSGVPIAPNLLNRNFTPAAPNQAWAGDITYIATEEGRLFLAVVIDLFSRRVVGWSMQPDCGATW